MRPGISVQNYLYHRSFGKRSSLKIRIASLGAWWFTSQILWMLDSMVLAVKSVFRPMYILYVADADSLNKQLPKRSEEIWFACFVEIVKHIESE